MTLFITVQVNLFTNFLHMLDNSQMTTKKKETKTFEVHRLDGRRRYVYNLIITNRATSKTQNNILQ